MEEKNRVEYDVQRRARAGTGATLRALVAGYLVYLAWQIVKGVRSGETSMSPAVGYAAAAFFLAALLSPTAFGLAVWSETIIPIAGAGMALIVPAAAMIKRP